jgi:hypothetical protein
LGKNIRSSALERAGRLGADLAVSLGAQPVPSGANPDPAPEAREILGWDDDPARGDRAWRAAAPLSGLAPIVAGAGDRVLVRALGQGPPLVLLRRIGRGQALLVKLAVFAVLLVGGAYNRLVLHPRLERAALGLRETDAGAGQALRISVAAELAMASVLLVVVAVLVNLPPP